eukprot:scaffold75761_cov32-Prasinocladus_malaysianus.AAC.1
MSGTDDRTTTLLSVAKWLWAELLRPWLMKRAVRAPRRLTVSVDPYLNSRSRCTRVIILSTAPLISAAGQGSSTIDRSCGAVPVHACQRPYLEAVIKVSSNHCRNKRPRM